MASLMPQGKQQYLDASGNLLAGGRVYTYAAGTDTPLATYTDASGGTPNANPVVLNARGEANIFWGGSAYKVVLKDASDVEIYTQDNLQAPAGAADLASYASGKGAALIGFDGGTVADFFKTKNNRVVDSITALRGLDKTKFTRAFVTGYYAAGDGGGGPYWYDSTDTTSSDNGGTIIVATDGGRWKLGDSRSISLRQFGAKGDSNGTTGNGTDDTARIQAAIDWVKGSSGRYKLAADEGVFRTTAALLIDGAISLIGEGVSPYDTAVGTRGNGSWLYFDHTGKGLQIDGANILSGVTLSNFGTLRNQPTPGAGWAPNAHDYDIYIDNADVHIPDLMLLNPTKGIFLTNGTAGRMEIGRLRGQAFQTMVRIDNAQDVVRIHSLHQWPFWKNDANVNAYTEANLDALYLERADNPILGDVFTIFARSSIRFGENASGRTLKFKLDVGDFDRGKYGIWIDSTVTSGVIGQVANITHQGETGVAGSELLRIDGNGNTLDFGAIRTDLCGLSALDVRGTGNTVRVMSATLLNYNQDAAAAAAVNVAAGTNTVHFSANPVIGSGTKYSATGTIYTEDWRSWTPTITTQTGTITTLGTVTAKYQSYNSKVTFEIVINITTNGTGAGDVRFTLPVTPASDGQGTGRETVAIGKGVHVSISASNLTASIAAADNTYPGANGAKIVCSGSYEI